MSADPDEARAQEEHVPEGGVIYRAIRSDGDHALRMSNAELVWSGLAAGLSMGFSLAAEGVLRAHLPDTPWRPLVAKFGYAVGFLIVILGRQQLFTEQTLTAMLSLFSVDRREGTIGNVARLWPSRSRPERTPSAGLALVEASSARVSGRRHWCHRARPLLPRALSARARLP